MEDAELYDLIGRVQRRNASGVLRKARSFDDRPTNPFDELLCDLAEAAAERDAERRPRVVTNVAGMVREAASMMKALRAEDLRRKQAQQRAEQERHTAMLVSELGRKRELFAKAHAMLDDAVRTGSMPAVQVARGEIMLSNIAMQLDAAERRLGVRA